MLSITILSVLGLLVLFIGFLNKPALTTGVSLLGIVAAILAFLYLPQNLLIPEGFETQLQFDEFANRFAILILGFAGLILVLSRSFFKLEHVQAPEFSAIVLFSLVGAIMLTAFNHMVTLFVGLETMGISMYILAGSDKKSSLSNEASLKYLLLGSFATCIILFGMALMYGATGSLDFNAIASIGVGQADSSLFQFGLFFLLVGMLFKVSAAPFHFWSPDVYEGSPNVVMAFMSIVVKIASFAALYRVFGMYLQAYSIFWWDLVYYATLASLVVGNLLALLQKTVKRQLAFSSISQTGYLLFAVLLATGSGRDMAGVVWFYLFVYGCAVIVAFSVLTDWFGSQPSVSLDELKGASRKDQIGALALTLAYLSMAGIPLTGGFFSKIYMFAPAIESGLVHLLIVGVLSSVVGAAYYFRPIINVWFSSENAAIENGTSYQWMAFFGAALLVVAGLFPDTIINIFALI